MWKHFLMMSMVSVSSLLAAGCKVEVEDDRPGIHVDRQADGDKEIHINTPRRNVDIEVDR